ncbi:MAG: cadmium-translocating P-type ATPase [Lentisphaeria bacterium]|nr:cadmium-translocating P-type ATPase [Victivallales bacterium]MCR4575185.1 cadmium-translocating P-type ATPase [Lentisphaeria bacterium]
MSEIQQKIDAAPTSRGNGESKVGKPEMLRLGIALFGGILVLNCYLSRVFFSDAIDETARDFSALAGALILSIPIFYEALRDLCKGKVHMNELVALALVAAFASRDYQTAGAVAFFMLITITIEKRTAIGAEAAIEAVVRLTPRLARRIVDGVEEEVDAFTDLQAGDVCRVRPGENFPADGIVTVGSSTVNQASITGESLPADKSVGNEVYAGTQNLTGLVEFRVTRIGSDTTLGKVRNLIADAERSKLPIMRMIDKYVGYYTPTILMIAGLVWFITMRMDRVIAVLVMSVPAAFVIATPSAVIAAIAAASRLGILIKDVSYIEQAARIGAIIFDKTGTLTEGKLAVARLEPAEGIELAQLLELATSAEHHSNHPAADAMRRLAREAKVEWREPQSYEEVAGLGVKAVFDGKQCLVGRKTWLADEGVNLSALEASLTEAEHKGLSVVCVACDGKAWGWIGLSDAIRSVSAEAISQLKELGVDRCCMVTGDNDRVAKAVAAQIGISEVAASCLPEQKEAYVRKLKKTGKIVAVVGDGVNDAPALAAGDIGIAMGAFGSDIAVQSASVALMNNDLRRIPFLIGLARRTRVLTIQNFAVGLGFIVVGVYLATLGQVTPVGAALLHSVSSLMVIFNSARLVRSGEMLQETTPED